MNRRVFRPSAVDELERLTLLSGLVPTTAAVAPTHFTRVHLGGTLTGTFETLLTIDTGTAFHFNGAGSIAHLGQVTATGGLGHGLVLLPHAKESGQFILTGPGGMLSISISATLPKNGTVPTLYTYKITGSTGSYANLVDHGTARLTLHVSPIVLPPSAPPGQATPAIVPTPSRTFTLTLTSAKGH
jgi:hypothetical protein